MENEIASGLSAASKLLFKTRDVQVLIPDD
jgi:hypothetical protein